MGDRHRSALIYSDDLRDNPEFCLQAVSKVPEALQDVTDDMRNNGPVVMAAVSRKGAMLKYASFELRENVNIVSVAVANDPSAIRYAVQSVKDELAENPELLSTGDPLAFGDVGPPAAAPAPEDTATIDAEAQA